MASTNKQPQLMDEEALKQWILRKLGAPWIKVELGDDNLFDCVEDARRWFASKKGIYRNAKMMLKLGSTEQDLPPDCDIVLDVFFNASNYDASMIVDPMSLMDGFLPGSSLGSMGLGVGGGLVSGYAQTLQYLDMAETVLGTQPEWYQQNDKLVVLGLLQSGVNSALITYKPRDFTIQQLHERDHDLIKRKALAIAKQFVGNIRATLQSFPGADGPIHLNGDRMLQEADREHAALEDEIFASAGPTGFSRG